MSLRLRASLVAVLATAALGSSAGSAFAVFTNVTTVSVTSAYDSAGTKSATATCPAGTRVTGAGGYATKGGGFGIQNLFVDAVRPSSSLEWVTVRAREEEGGTSDSWEVTATAICAPSPSGLMRAEATSADTSANKNVVAACPAGKRLLGTGGETGGAGADVRLDGLHPDAALTKTTANGVEDETGAGASWTVTAYAICAEAIAGLERRSFTSAESSNVGIVQAAHCPDGKVMTGTGATINSPGNQALLTTLLVFPPPPTAMQVNGAEDANGTAEDWSVTGYAICAAHATRHHVSSVHTGDAIKALPMGCPPGMAPTAVGGEVNGGLGNVWLRWLRAPNLDSAEVLAAEVGNEDSWSVTAREICLTERDSTTVVSEAGTLGTAREKTATVSCPGGLRVLGAGGQVHVGTPSSLENQTVFLEAVRPGASLVSVTVRARQVNASETFSWNPMAWAVCGQAPAGLQRVASTSPAESGEVATATSRCPAGKHLIGIGGEISGGFEHVGLDDLYPAADMMSTKVLATRDGSGGVDPWSATAYGICINR